MMESDCEWGLANFRFSRSPQIWLRALTWIHHGIFPSPSYTLSWSKQGFGNGVHNADRSTF